MGEGMGETGYRQVTNQYWNRFADHCTIFSKKYQIFLSFTVSFIISLKCSSCNTCFFLKEISTKECKCLCMHWATLSASTRIGW